MNMRPKRYKVEVSEDMIDEYRDYVYDYHGTYYEVVGVKYGKVILQDLSSDYSTTISLADWDDFHSKYVIKFRTTQ